MIKSIINNYASSDCNLTDLRFATMSTLLYVGLFRSQKLLDMKLCDLYVTETYLEVRLPKSKTDIYRLGQTVFIPKSGLYTCPYSLLIRYLNQCRSKGRGQGGPCPPQFFSQKVKTDLYKMLKIRYYQATVCEVFKKRPADEV